MSPLLPFRSRLSALRRRLWTLRVGTLWGRLALLWLGLVAAVFVFDFLVEPPRAIRAPLTIVLVIVTLYVVYRALREAFRRLPTFVELALQVERQHGIDSDLVAALQFESNAAKAWGSPQLQNAVITHVAETGARLNPAAAISRQPLAVWAGLSLAAVLSVVALAFIYPAHAKAFANRMLFGMAHYPTRTQIEFVLVNRTVTLAADRLQAVKSAYGKDVVFRVYAKGQLPDNGTVLLRTAGGEQARVVLRPFVDEQSKLRWDKDSAALQELRAEVSHGGDPTALGDFAAAKMATIHAAIAELPEVIRPVDLPDLQIPSEAELRRLESLLAAVKTVRIYTGQLAQLVESLSYQVFLGDAWTDPLELRAIPLPVVEVSLKVTAPEYTRSAESAKGDANSRQAAVIEGSRIELSLASTKPLLDAVVTIGSQPFKCIPTSRERLSWQLPAGTPLDSIADAVSYSLQVTDDDGMQLPEPIKGFIRLKADRPPKVFADVTTRHVLPTARPNLWFGAVDDYGLRALKLQLLRIRDGDEGVAKTMEIPIAGHPRRIAPLMGSLVAERKTALDRQTLSTELRNDLAQLGVQLSPAVQLAVQQPGSRWLLTDPVNSQLYLLRLERGAVQVYRQFLIDLSGLDLRLDDQVRMELEAVDFRGNQSGKSSKSEVVILHVTDERGVYAAMQESDQKTAQQLNDIIQRHLGIGGSP